MVWREESFQSPESLVIIIQERWISTANLMFPPHREIKPVLSGSSSSSERYGAFTEKRIKVYAKKETKFWAGDMNGGKNISGDQLRFSWHQSLFESRGITQVNLENVEKRKTSCETLKICYWNVIPAMGWTLPRLVGCHDWINMVFSYDDSSLVWTHHRRWTMLSLWFRKKSFSCFFRKFHPAVGLRVKNSKVVKSWFTLHYTENKDYQLQSRRAESDQLIMSIG